jgi:branched-chain amino acid transport system ATP-binding protein
MLEVEDLSANYNRIQAVRQVSLTADKGLITLVLGPNGAGKSTLLRSIAGLHRSYSGEVRLNGHSITGRPAHRIARSGLSLVPEGRHVFAPLTVRENLRLGAYGKSSKVFNAGLTDVLTLFPILGERLGVAAGLLSGGEQQMLAFARALLSRPSVILLDEPSMGLSPSMVAAILDSASAMAASGIAIVMVEQNADAALPHCDRVLVLSRGEAVLECSASEAASDPAVIRNWLGEAFVSGSSSSSTKSKFRLNREESP